MRMYRGMTKDGKWVKGWYVKTEYYSLIIPDKTPINHILGDCIEVLPETVGQSTGLKDKNGVEIFIGDIVKTKVGPVWYEREVHQVENGAYCIKLPVMYSTDEVSTMLIVGDYEVIGNIHTKEQK